MLSIQDETSAADTAKVIRDSGLADEVYLGDAGRPWPTLRELIDRDERVIVLAENHAGGAPWIHHQPAVMQETPFLFRSVAALEAPDELRAQPRWHRRLAAAGQPLGRHPAAAARVDRPPRERPRLPRRPRRALPQAARACSRTWWRSTSTARAPRPRSSTSSTACARHSAPHHASAAVAVSTAGAGWCSRDRGDEAPSPPRPRRSRSTPRRRAGRSPGRRRRRAPSLRAASAAPTVRKAMVVMCHVAWIIVLVIRGPPKRLDGSIAGDSFLTTRTSPPTPWTAAARTASDPAAISGTFMVGLPSIHTVVYGCRLAHRPRRCQPRAGRDT